MAADSEKKKKNKQKLKKKHPVDGPNKESKKQNKRKKHQDELEEAADPVAVDRKMKKNKNKKRKLQQREQDEGGDGAEHDKPRAYQDKRSGKRNKRSKHGAAVVTDERFASVHFDPRFQRVPKKEAKVTIDSRFAKMLEDESFAASSAPVDKRGRPRKEKGESSLRRYYHNEKEDEERKKEEEDEEGESGPEAEVEASTDEVEGDGSSTTDEDDDDYDYDDDQDMLQSDITQYLMASHEETPLIEQETHRLAVVNMDWDHIKAVDLYVAISSCLPKGGQILSVAVYPTEYGLKCMEVEAVRGPSALIDNNDSDDQDESESEDEDLRNEKLRAYELSKLRYYHGVVVFDSSATANHIYKDLDGTELLRTSNVFDLRFIPDSMEFQHPPRDIVTQAPARYTIPDFQTRALQHSTVKLSWEDDEPRRTKILRRKFNPDQLDELNEYLASSESDANEEGETDVSEKEDAGASPNGKSKKHMDREKLRALLLAGDGSGSDKDEDDDHDMEITFNTGLEDLSKRILEKKEKKQETVWEQVLRRRSEKRKARRNRSKHSSEDDSSDSDVQEAPDQPDDFFMEEDTSDSNAGDRNMKKKDSSKGKRDKRGQKQREESPDTEKEQEASKAELELLFADDHDGKCQTAKGYKLKPNKRKGKKEKDEAAEAKLPDVDLMEDPRFSDLFTSHLFALDPTDPQFKRSATYARQQLAKRKTGKGTKQREETVNTSDNDEDRVLIEKEKHDISSTVRSLKRNLGNLKKGTKSR